MPARILCLLTTVLCLAGSPAAGSPGDGTPGDGTPSDEEASTGASAAGTPGGRILFIVTGFRNDKGRLRCGLFSEAGWLDVSVRSVAAEIEDARGVCEFTGVPAGTYGISSYHDKNDNGRMDLGVMRIPKEAYAASNDARGSFGPPAFADARFIYEGGLLELAADIR